jgi:hypothetical protein
MRENLSMRRVKHLQSLYGYERAPSTYWVGPRTGLYEEGLISGPLLMSMLQAAIIPITSSGFLLQCLETSHVFILLSAFRWSLYQQQTALSELSSLAA